MQFLYNPDGTRNRDFQNYIFSEETTFDSSIYDPHRAVNYGMYDWPIPPPSLRTDQDVYRYNQKLLRSGTMYSDAAKSDLTMYGELPVTCNMKREMQMGAIPPIYQSDYNKQVAPYTLYGVGWTASGSGAMGNVPRSAMYKRLFAT